MGHENRQLVTNSGSGTRNNRKILFLKGSLSYLNTDIYVGEFWSRVGECSFLPFFALDLADWWCSSTANAVWFIFQTIILGSESRCKQKRPLPQKCAISPPRVLNCLHHLPLQDLQVIVILLVHRHNTVMNILIRSRVSSSFITGSIRILI